MIYIDQMKWLIYIYKSKRRNILVEQNFPKEKTLSSIPKYQNPLTKEVADTTWSTKGVIMFMVKQGE